MDSTQKINWDSSESHLFLSPHLSEKDQANLHFLFESFGIFPGHLWIPSSGSTASENQSLKLIALSKKAFVSSARSVNEFLGTQPGDRWVQVLPRYHVGGLAIEARAHVGQFQVLSFQEKWNPQRIYQALEKENAQWISLVPTQLYDLVQLRKSSPRGLKGVLMGGAALDSDLLGSALKLGYPVIESYGMTETCSMVAGRWWLPEQSQNLEDRTLQALSHCKFSLWDELLQIQTSSALTGFAQTIDGRSQFFTPEKLGVVATQDLCELSEGGARMKWLGRASRFVKILGEGVDLDWLQSQWQRQAEGLARETYMASEVSSRKGSQIVLYVEEGSACKELVLEWNKKALGLHRIHALFWVKKIPRSALGKPLLHEITKQLLQREDLIL
ncbi:MAG: AMP-binding protein [Pseudobdellovibrionaceae bacterium]